MSRQPRITGEYLHIIVRGIGKQILFEESSDNKQYLYYLKKYAEQESVSILAYCLMDNHVHILVRDTRSAISGFMKKIGVSYAQYYNRKYERTGHLFQDRYKSENITDDAYLLSTFRYILNNPAKAGICEAAEYPWSSYREYGEKNGLTDTEMLYDMIGDRKELGRFILQKDETEHMEADAPPKDDVRALKILQDTLNITSGTQIQQYGRIQRDEALVLLKNKGLSVRQLERLTGINRGIIQRAKTCQTEPSL